MGMEGAEKGRVCIPSICRCVSLKCPYADISPNLLLCSMLNVVQMTFHTIHINVY